MGKSRRHSRTVSSHHLGPVLRITVSPYARKKVFKPVRRVVSATGGNTKIRLTPAPLRLDPDFDPLRGDPRFEKLAHSDGK